MEYISLAKALAANALVTGAITGVVAWAGKVWADRRLERLKTQNSEQLERLRGQNTEQLEKLRADLAAMAKRDQAGIDRQMLVFRTHFDVEYKNYLELWALCDVSYDLAAQALTLYQLSPVDEEARKEGKADAVRDFDKCREALGDARRRRPFIQQDVCDAAVKLLYECMEIRHSYMRCYDTMHRPGSGFDPSELIRETKAQLDRMHDNYDHLARMIAARVERMYVVD